MDNLREIIKDFLDGLFPSDVVIFINTPVKLKELDSWKYIPENPAA